MTSRYEHEAWANLGPGLANIFQNWGQQRARKAEFKASLAQDELRRRDAKDAADNLHEIRMRTLELDEERAKREKEQAEYDRENEDEIEDLRSKAATAYTRLYTPQQMPTGPSERYRSPTSPVPGGPRGVGTPRFEEPSDIVGTLKNMGMSDEVIQSIISGEKGPLPITQKPKEMTPKEYADFEKVLSETAENRAQIYRLLNPLPRAGGGAGDEGADVGAMANVRKALGGVTPNQALDVLFKKKSGESEYETTFVRDPQTNEIVMEPDETGNKVPRITGRWSSIEGDYMLSGPEWDAYRQDLIGEIQQETDQQYPTWDEWSAAIGQYKDAEYSDEDIIALLVENMKALGRKDPQKDAEAMMKMYSQG